MPLNEYRKKRNFEVTPEPSGNGKNTSKPSWLLIKHRDEHASKDDVTLEQPRSAISKRMLAQIARDGGGDVEVAAIGDPK